MSLGPLRAKVHDLAVGYGGTCGIVIEEVSSGDVFQFNQDEQFSAASIIKLSILWELYRQMDSGQVDASERVRLNEPHRVGGAGVLQALDAGLLPTIRDLATLMIIVSDNVATNLLIDRVGMDQINQTMEDLGLEKTLLQRKMKDEARARQGFDNMTTAAETASLLVRLIGAAELSAGSRDEMLAILKQQQFNDRLSAGLPRDVVFAHKTGQLDEIEHDAGIFFFGDNPVIAVVLTRELPINRRGAALCSAIGKLIYTQFASQGWSGLP